MPSDSPADYERSYHLYYYLCACLAFTQKPSGAINAKAIEEHLGKKELRKVVTALLQDDLSPDERSRKLGRLSRTTTGDVVKLLSNLRNSLAEGYQNFELPHTRVLAVEDMLTTLSKLVELAPEERHALGLQAGDGLTLLQRSLLILQTVGGLENYEMLLRLYKATVGLDFSQAEIALKNLGEVDDLVNDVVRQSLAFLPSQDARKANSSNVQRREDTVKELTRKAQREVRRLLARSGNQQLSSSGEAIVDYYVRQYLQPAFVKKLAQTIVANERLTDQFPVYLKRITLTPSGPLPFADKELDVLTQSSGPYPPLLHPALRQLDQSISLTRYLELPGPGDYELASQESTQVVVEFYVKVPQGYEPIIGDVLDRLGSQDRRRIDFTVSSTGIGGALSHVIKVINKALLQDIPCLREYFPIAHDVTSTQAIIRDNVASPVWAHSLVKLCRRQLVGETLNACQDNEFSDYENFSFADPIGHGDYCGFDFLLSQAQASLQARLQAIRSAGIRPDKYIQQLCQRVERSQVMQDAWTCLQGYPFSSLAMIGMIEQNLLPIGPDAEAQLQKTDPYIYFDACLSIVEALLDEGVYRPVRPYLRRLEILDRFVEQGLESTRLETEPFEVFSGALVIRYLLCLANYYYIYDTSDREPQYLPPGCQADVNRDILVQRAWETLDQAQRHASLRLRKYVVLNEVSQGTFHPHYLLLSRMAFLRTKLLLFFPRRVPRDDDYLPTESFVGRQRTDASIHWGRVYMAEKARLYAAADGDSEVYACYAAMQAWVYLIAAYTEAGKLNLITQTNGNRSRQLDPNQCFAWARQLRNHALITYAETGRQCYYQIKEKSGLLKNNLDEFGAYYIEKIPPIYETRGPQYSQLVQSEKQLLVLDMSLLAVNPKDLPKVSPHHPTRTIYLFGTNACHLFFIRGLFMVCSNVASEFDPDDAPLTEIDWEGKLLHATRLLNTAWAIAEEGGVIEKDKQDDKRTYRISRAFNLEKQVGAFSSPEIDSIRDLYPRRINEISDLGKIFAIACMVLRLSLVQDSDRTALETDIDALLSSLHNAHSLKNSLTQRALLKRQKRYNGHLESYLAQAKKCLRNHQQQACQPKAIWQKRDDLFSELFSTLGET
ncbi:hypothetical protein IQ254_19440 [Nodosilinea sp. LEGE 07088]|uniref:hypothetical protein n=1 Tax=Nodosilinea sp. LEGE 07088 TaxID=2777968 RepID=UPI00187F30ED|nr:hypothetical protein [Nodosilinea sp. LEGE 07088]MBE9139345.1 hypothetical protein [Nodosilinea sp. LEGE 07088]